MKHMIAPCVDCFPPSTSLPRKCSSTAFDPMQDCVFLCEKKKKKAARNSVRSSAARLGGAERCFPKQFSPFEILKLKGPRLQ